MSGKQKQFKAFWAGLMFMAVGGYMVFVLKDLLGFIPSIIGALLLFWRWK